MQEKRRVGRNVLQGVMTTENKSPSKAETAPAPGPATVKKDDAAKPSSKRKEPAKEVGGRDGPDPTRFGDWEKNGRCIDF